MNDNVKLWNNEQHHARNAELVCQILQSNDKQVVNLATTEFYTILTGFVARGPRASQPCAISKDF